MVDRPSTRPALRGPWGSTSHGGGVSRRGLLAGGVALVGLVAATRSAKSLEVVHTTALLPEIPERDGVLSWRMLSQVAGDGWSDAFAFDPQVEALDGKDVTVEGYMLPYDDQAKQRQFLLTAFPAHCPYCMPGGMASLIEVDAAAGVPTTEQRILLRGRLELLRGDGFGLLYRLRNATVA